MALPAYSRDSVTDSRVPGSPDNDPYVLKARRFIGQLSSCRGEKDYLVVLDNDPDSFYAWDLRDGMEAVRWEVEARLLANETIETISKKVCLSAGAIRTYEAWFFNVLDRLESPGYLTHTVFLPATQRGLTSRAYDCLWKMFGYWGGPMVLDLMIYQFMPAPRPDNRKTTRAFFGEDVCDTLHVKASIAMRTMPINWQTQIEIVNTYMHMVELEKNAQMGGGGGSSMLANMETALRGLSAYWSCNVPAIDMEDPVAIADAGRYSLRASELLLLGSNPDAIKTIEPLAMSAVYPDASEVSNVETSAT
jgi:hypothetical protein